MADSPRTMGFARLIEARRASHDLLATAPGFGRLDPPLAATLDARQQRFLDLLTGALFATALNIFLQL